MDLKILFSKFFLAKASYKRWGQNVSKSQNSCLLSNKRN